MKARLLVLALVAGGAWFALENSRTIRESHVHDAMKQGMEALRSFDEDAACAGLAADYRLELTEYVDGRAQGTVVVDQAQACERSLETIRTMRLLDARTRGMLAFDVRVDIHAIQIEPDGRGATVSATTTVMLGDILVARARGVERLSRAAWQVRTHGGTSQVWSYGG